MPRRLVGLSTTGTSNTLATTKQKIQTDSLDMIPTPVPTDEKASGIKKMTWEQLEMELEKRMQEESKNGSENMIETFPKRIDGMKKARKRRGKKRDDTFDYTFRTTIVTSEEADNILRAQISPQNKKPASQGTYGPPVSKTTFAPKSSKSQGTFHTASGHPSPLYAAAGCAVSTKAQAKRPETRQSQNTFDQPSPIYTTELVKKRTKQPDLARKSTSNGYKFAAVEYGLTRDMSQKSSSSDKSHKAGLFCSKSSISAIQDQQAQKKLPSVPAPQDQQAQKKLPAVSPPQDQQAPKKLPSASAPQDQQAQKKFSSFKPFQSFRKERKTSPARQQLWLTMLQEAIREAKDFETITETADEVCSRSLTLSEDSGVFSDPESASLSIIASDDEEDDGTDESHGFYPSSVVRRSIQNLTLSNDDVSVSSIEYLYNWMTCGKMDWPTSGQYRLEDDPRGMVIETSSEEGDESSQKRNRKGRKKKKSMISNFLFNRKKVKEVDIN